MIWSAAHVEAFSFFLFDVDQAVKEKNNLACYGQRYVSGLLASASEELGGIFGSVGALMLAVCHGFDVTILGYWCRVRRDGLVASPTLSL